MEFQKSFLSRLRDIFLEGSFNDITIQCIDGERGMSSFLMGAISPLFRQDPSWTSLILPDISTKELDEFIDNLLVHGVARIGPGSQKVLNLLESFSSSSFPKRKRSKQSLKTKAVASNYVRKKIIDTPRAETAYELRPLRKKVKFSDELSDEEEVEENGDGISDSQSDYEPLGADEEEEEEEDIPEDEIEEDKKSESKAQIRSKKPLSVEDEGTSSQDEEDEDEDTLLLKSESEGEDDDLYEYHSSFHHAHNSEEEDLTLLTVKVNEEGRIQTIHHINDRGSKGLTSNVGHYLSETLGHDALRNVSTHRLLYKCFMCPEQFGNLCELRYHSVKYHPDGSFFRLPQNHPHSKCLSCSQLFSTYKDLIASNKELKLKDLCFRCPHCRRRFMGRINALRTHLKEEHFDTVEKIDKSDTLKHLVLMKGESQTLICDFCNILFETTRLLNYHLLDCAATHFGISAGLFCRQCGATFSQLNTLHAHCMYKHRGKTILNLSEAVFCSLCPVVRMSEEALREHKLKYHREFPLVTIHEGCVPCTHLTESFYNNFSNSTKDILFKCPHCKMLFAAHHNDPIIYIYNHIRRFHRNSEIKDFHQNWHGKGVFLKIETDTFKCDFCSETMLSRLDFNDHISACPLSDVSCKPKYICKFCEFTSVTSRNLRLHIGASHSELSPGLVLKYGTQEGRTPDEGKRPTHSKCPHCGKLKTGASLRSHVKRCKMSSSMSTSKIKCTDCELDFKHLEDMQAHSLIHYGQVTCPIHNILFKSESEIYHHVNVGGANSSPILQCCMCCRHFRYMCNFMTHLRRHLKISPYRCSICQKSVQSYANLRHHVRRMHMEESSNKHFSCEYCSKGFTTKGHLKEHIAGVHERYNNVHCPVCHKSFNTQKRMKKHLFSSHKEMADQFRSHSKVEVFSRNSPLKAV